MPPETASESVYAELEPHIATDKIEYWFDLSSSDDTVEPHQSVALIAARAQLERLVKQRDWLDRELAAMRVAHQGACEMVAQMHAAAVGEATAPIRGVVEDVQDLRARCLAAEESLSTAPHLCGVALGSTDGRTRCELAPHGADVRHESSQPDGQRRLWGDNESDA